MKVPELADNALDDMHMWKSSDGNEIEAMFVAADESVLTLVMKKTQAVLTKFPGIVWTSLSGPGRTQAAEESSCPRTPAYPAKGGRLASTVKASGKGTTLC